MEKQKNRDVSSDRHGYKSLLCNRLSDLGQAMATSKSFNRHIQKRRAAHRIILEINNKAYIYIYIYIYIYEMTDVN